MFADFDEAASSGQQVVQGVRLNAGLELLKEPEKQQTPMAALDVTAGLAHGDRALPLPRHSALLFFQEGIGQHHQSPEAQDGLRAHQLVLVQAKFLFAIGEEHFNVPARRDVLEELGWGGIKIVGGPVPCLREASRKLLAHDDDLAVIELAHRDRHDMHIHGLASSGPGHLNVVLLAQPGDVIAQFLPAPALRNRLIGDAQPAIAFETGGDEKAAGTSGAPQTLGAIPAIEQEMCHGSLRRLKRPDQLFHEVDLALEKHLFGVAYCLLMVQLRSQRAAAIQQHIESLDQAMTHDPLVFGRRVVPVQPFHLLAFRFAHRRVIEGHIPGHEGLLGTASTLGLKLALTVSFRLHQRPHLLAEVREPASHQFLLRSRGLREIPAQSSQTGIRSHFSQQSRQRSSSFTLHQPQQYGHEVLVLRLTQQDSEPLGKVTQLVIQAYNGQWHRTPPWFQVYFFFLNTTWCPFLSPLLSKSANIEKR